MNVIEKIKAEQASEFVAKMNLVQANSATINELEQLSAELHSNGIPNTAHVVPHDSGSITIFISIRVWHEEYVIRMLHLLKLRNYMPEVIISDGRGVKHGYRLGDIVISLEQQHFPEDSLRTMHGIVFGQCDEQADAGTPSIPAFLLKDNDAKTESEVQA